FFGSRANRWASEPVTQCMRRGYSGLEPLKKAALVRRPFWSRSVTSSAHRCESCVKAILVWPPKPKPRIATPLVELACAAIAIPPASEVNLYARKTPWVDPHVHQP